MTSGHANKKANTGSIQISSSLSTGLGRSGDLKFASGKSNSGGNSGSIIISSGDSFEQPGHIYVRGGVSKQSDGGHLILKPGDTLSSAKKGGDLNLYSGAGTGQKGASGGSIHIVTASGTKGTTDGGLAGEFSVTTGSSEKGGSGAINMTAGDLILAKKGLPLQYAASMNFKAGTQY